MLFQRVIPGLFAAVLLVSFVTPVGAKHSPAPYSTHMRSAPQTRVSLDRPPSERSFNAAAALDTTWLGSWTFDACTPEGWTSVDNNAQGGPYFHVDDFAGLDGLQTRDLLYAPEGNQALWCGVRPDPLDLELCSYLTLPGYGNNWDQRFGTVDCLNVTGDVEIYFLSTWDSEPGYDRTCVQYDQCDDDWVTMPAIVTGYYSTCIENWGEGAFSVTIPDSLHSSNIRIRFRFTSDGAWSDQDGFWYSDGAIVIDSLSVHDDGGEVIPTELFETESVGDLVTTSGNWEASVAPSYGDFAGLFPGSGVVQENSACTSNLTCLWGFFAGSTANYACGGYPAQAVVPYGNADGQYISNEIWSPWMEITGSGALFEVAWDRYNDFDTNALIVPSWYTRSLVDGCPTRWIDDNTFYWPIGTGWQRVVQSFGSLIEPGATHVQMSLGVIDMCPWWCGSVGTGQCHSHAPLYDNVEVRRIDLHGPAWNVRDVDLFQDNFASDGTTSGTVRADAALDLLPLSNPIIRPGDSVAVNVSVPEGSLAGDPFTGTGPAVYAYVNVHPPGQAGKQGPALSSDVSRWPVVDSLIYGGDTWYTIRMDTAFTGPGSPSGAFCVDLNDNLFTPGDTVSYCFGATAALPTAGSTYYSRFTGVTDDMNYALSNAMEFTCLPTQHAYPILPGSSPSVWIEPTLYVDFADGRGVQPYFDAAFEELGIAAHVDRYDVLAPSSGQGNSPAGRVVDVGAQLIPAYARIIWSTGDLGYGVLGTEKANDAAMLLSFLDQVPLGGVFFTGDDIAETWNGLSGAAATMRSTYLQHTLSSGDHTTTYGVSPTVNGVAAGIFDHGNQDTWVAYGGCPTLADFDVVTPSGTATSEALYDGGPGSAVIAQATQKFNPYSQWARVVLAGFSFDEIQNVTRQGQPDTPAHILWDILLYINSNIYSGAGDTPLLRNSLAQNVPNPFNPTTTIEFTLKEQAAVTLRVYNVRGQRVRTLVDDTRAPGIVHRITWDGHNDAGQRVASGVYFCRMVTRDFTSTRKMVLLK